MQASSNVYADWGEGENDQMDEGVNDDAQPEMGFPGMENSEAEI